MTQPWKTEWALADSSGEFEWHDDEVEAREAARHAAVETGVRVEVIRIRRFADERDSVGCFDAEGQFFAADDDDDADED